MILVLHQLRTAGSNSTISYLERNVVKECLINVQENAWILLKYVLMTAKVYSNLAKHNNAPVKYQMKNATQNVVLICVFVAALADLHILLVKSRAWLIMTDSASVIVTSTSRIDWMTASLATKSASGSASLVIKIASANAKLHAGSARAKGETVLTSARASV